MRDSRTRLGVVGATRDEGVGFDLRFSRYRLESLTDMPAGV